MLLLLLFTGQTTPIVQTAPFPEKPEWADKLFPSLVLTAANSREQIFLQRNKPEAALSPSWCTAGTCEPKPVNILSTGGNGTLELILKLFYSGLQFANRFASFPHRVFNKISLTEDGSISSPINSRA